MPWYPGIGTGLTALTQYGYGGRPGEPNTGFPKLGVVSETTEEKKTGFETEFGKKFTEFYQSGINNPKLFASSENADDYKRDFLYVQLEPKIKWFKPPFSIKIFKWEISFMWAYKVHKAYELKDCIPVSMNTSHDSSSIDIEFKCNPYNSKEVQEVAEELKNKICKGDKND